MSVAKRGIKRVIVCDTGTLATTFDNLVVAGTRKPGSLLISPLDTIRDHRNRDLRNLMNFKMDSVSLQGRMRDLELLIDKLSDGFDLQIACVPQSSDERSGGVFDFTAFTAGLGFEYALLAKERYLNLMFETAMEYESAKTFIDGADSTGDLTPDISALAEFGLNQEGQNFNLYAHPWYIELQAPDATEIFSKKEIVDRKFSLKTKGYKNAYNEEVPGYITAMLELTGTNALISHIVTLLGKDMGASLTVKEGLGGTTYFEEFNFGANILTHREEFNIGDDKREAKIIFEGDLTPDQFAFAYGSTKGGVGTPTTELEYRGGGTCTISV